MTYNSFTSYLTGQDPYRQDPAFGQTDAAFGTTAATLDFVGPGPLGGSFEFSGAARADATQLGVSSQYWLQDYADGSYVLVATPTFDYLPIAGLAQALAIDQVVVEGNAVEYTVRFDYRLTGSALRGDATYDSYFRPVLAASAMFSQDGVPMGTGATSFYPTTGSIDMALSLTATNVPANVPLSLTQFLQTKIFAADSLDVTDIDPFVTDDWDPSHITYSTGLVGDGPHTVAAGASFLNTLDLVHVAILDASGAPAIDAVLASENGVRYPGQGVPEPSALLSASAALALGVAKSRRRARRVVPATRLG